MKKPKTAKAGQPLLIRTQTELVKVCEAIREAGVFAFDTEFVMEDRYASEVCLVQVAWPEGVGIIDPFDSIDLKPVWSLVVSPEVETVVHAGQEDLSLAVRHAGGPPKNVFDVQIAAGFVGYDYPISLQKLVKSALQIDLHKSKTLTDWRRRPLSDAQVHYAAEDVNHLLPVRQRLLGQLKRRKRLDWVREEMSRLEDPGQYRREEEDVLQRVKGLGALKGQQLAVAREIVRWRDKVAQRVNRPAKTVLRDHLLVEVARHGLSTPGEIRDLRGVNVGTRDLQELAGVVRESLKIPEESWPTRKRTNHAEPVEETTLVALMSAVLRSYCDENRIAYGLAATKKSIQELVRHHMRRGPADQNGLDLLAGWRGETVGALAEDILHGRRSMSVAREKDQLRIRLTNPAGADKHA